MRRRYNWVFITALFAVGGMIAGMWFRSGRADTVFKSGDMPRVIVDAGHGEPDGGAVGANGTLEKDVNLSIALKTAEVLEGKGIRAILTRTGDSGLYSPEDTTLRQKKRSDMNTRLNIMKNSGADLFLSIHMNSYQNSNAEGLNVFYAKNYPELEELCTLMQERMSAVTGAQIHTVRAADTSLFLMKSPPVPSVLAECGFLSNPDEEEKLCDEMYQSKIAWALAEAIEVYFDNLQS